MVAPKDSSRVLAKTGAYHGSGQNYIYDLDMGIFRNFDKFLRIAERDAFAILTPKQFLNIVKTVI
jgi:hypothetical protein